MDQSGIKLGLGVRKVQLHCYKSKINVFLEEDIIPLMASMDALLHIETLVKKHNLLFVSFFFYLIGVFSCTILRKGYKWGQV